MLAMASSNSPCAACKFLRRKCTAECVFAPYFPPDQPQKFANVHKVFGASNVAKILSDIPPPQREDAVNSLAYEAETRLRDPIYGCVGVISVLQHQLKQLQTELYSARNELSKYIGGAGPGLAVAQAMVPHALFHPHQQQFLHPHMQFHHQHLQHQQQASCSSMGGIGINLGGGGGGSREQLILREQQQLYENQMAVREQQELMRSYDQELASRIGNSYEQEIGFNQMSAPSSGLGTFIQFQQVQQQKQEPPDDGVGGDPAGGGGAGNERGSIGPSS